MQNKIDHQADKFSHVPWLLVCIVQYHYLSRFTLDTINASDLWYNMRVSCLRVKVKEKTACLLSASSPPIQHCFCLLLCPYSMKCIHALWVDYFLIVISPFKDQDFRPCVCSWPRLSFGSRHYHIPKIRLPAMFAYCAAVLCVCFICVPPLIDSVHLDMTVQRLLSLQLLTSCILRVDRQSPLHILLFVWPWRII